jgi:cytochrome P450
MNSSYDGTDFRPPAPEPLPSMAGPLTLLKALWNNPIEAWTKDHFERPIVTTRLPFGEVVVVSHPSAIRRILADNSENYRKDRLQKRMLAVLRGGILTAEDEQWRSQRRALAPAFTMKTVQNFARPMVRCIEELIAQMRPANGQVMDIAVAVTALALVMLERTIFSEGISSTHGDIRDAMREYFDSLGRIDPFDLANLPDFIPRLSRLRARSAVRTLHGVVDRMIVTRRGECGNQSPDAPPDILALLLAARDPDTGRGLNEQEIRANVMTLMAAGHESTANAITWALYLLSRTPEWRQRVLDEATLEWKGPLASLPARLVTTRAVVDEALRLYPPLAAISRVALGPDELAGKSIRRGTLIVIAPYVLHRHCMWWNRPDIFDPSRFVPRARGKIDRYAYLPFGGGIRGCIGSSFALQETVLTVAAVTKHFDLSVAPGHDVWPVHRITLRPRDGLPMIIRQRRSTLPIGSSPVMADQSV